MAKARLNLSIDKEVKEEVGKILHTLGLDYTTAINIYFTQIIRERGIPFEVSLNKRKGEKGE